MVTYNHKEIEKKWQAYWADNHTFKTGTDADKPNFYALDMFPYPSGAGLHVDIQKDTLRLIFLAALNVLKVTTFFTHWVGMLLDFLPNNTQWIQVMTQLNLQLKTLQTSNAKSTHLVSHMTGIVK